MNEAVIVSSVRTACGRAGRGSLANVRPEHIAASALKGALDRCPGLEPSDVEDVILGCAMPEGEQGVNIARVAALKAGLPVEVPAMTVNRMCASGLQTIVLAAEGIMTGAIDVALAGGVESMSMVPMMGSKFAPDPDLAREWPDVYLSMGLTAENLTAKYGITREDQDAFAYQSHMKAIAAQDGGKFAEEIVPIPIKQVRVKNGRRVETTSSFEVDEGPRRDTSLEALAKLRPAFSPRGSMVSGQMTRSSLRPRKSVVPDRWLSRISSWLSPRPVREMG